MKFYKCPICGNIIEVIDGDINHVRCCGVELIELIANTVDAAVEKHVPVYEIKGNEIEVTVGEAIHPMENDHYITMIMMSTNDKVIRKNLKPGEEPKAVFPYIVGSTIYEYCNKHGLWKNEIK